MEREKKFESLTTTSVTVEADQLREARAAGINISELLRSAIAAALKAAPAGVSAPVAVAEASRRAHAVPDRLMVKALCCVWENPKVAGRWAEMLNSRCNAELRPEDLIALVPRY